MKINTLIRQHAPLSPAWLSFFCLFFLLPLSAPAQTTATRSLITQPIDETDRVVLKGNTYPLARPEFDRGAAPPSLAMQRMLLVLRRTPEQESALQSLLEQQQDKSSPNFHNWLTPEQFGQKFGPSDQDIQAVTSWLQSHGFQVAKVSKGRTVIEFSGTAAQVQQAFRTEIHKFTVNGEDHWANASDPQIPSALAPVVVGVATLHNFVKHSNLATMSRHAYLQRRPKGGVDLCTVSQSPCPSNDVVHALGPADLSTIYDAPNSLNANPPSVLINGDAIRVGVIGRSNINLSDIQTFRDLFGLEANFTQSNIVLDGPDPGNLGGVEELEAVLDASWAGAAAPNAIVEFVVSQSTETTDGVDLSEVYIVDNNLADVMTESFGLCEQDAVQALANAEAAIAEQAAAQGITFFASSDDTGAVCTSTPTETIATEIPASLPFVTAVGGTMFMADDASYWSSSDNDLDLESALKYIPEDVWNETFPNGSQGAGGGGVSTLFAAPHWQTGVTGLQGTMRQVPDVSLTAAPGHDPFIICVEDQGASCLPGGSVLVVGGTSASTPSFAGIMALVVESQVNQRQGQAGYVLYNLAAAEMNTPATLAACNSTGASPPASTCVFNDITTGNNVFAGEAGSTTDFQAAPGYDLASGLGSVNVANLISKWKTAGTTRATASLTTLTSTTTFPIVHGSPASFSITVAPQTGTGTPTGDVSIIVSPTDSSAGVVPGGIKMATFTLANGSVASSTDALPGGTYALMARYEGDGTFLPSDSSPFGPITVSQENSQTQVLLVLLNLNTGAISFPTSLPYGSNDAIRVNVASTNAAAPCAGNKLGNFGCPTGTATISKNTGRPLDGGTFALNSLGFTEDQAIPATLGPGTYNLQANYSGDDSFKASSGSESIAITPAITSVALSASATSISSTGSTTLTATISTQSFGNPPTGNVTFTLNGSTQLGTVAVSGSFNVNTGFAQATAALTTTQLPTGQDSVTAEYTGDSNYATSISSAIIINVGLQPDFVISANPLPINVPRPGASGSTTLTITGQNGYNGTINFSAAMFSNLPPESSASFTSTSVTGSGTTTLSILTMGPSQVLPGARPHGVSRWTPVGTLALASILCLVLWFFRARPQRHRFGSLLALLAFAALVAVAACGGGGGGGGGPTNPGTPPGLYPNASVTLSDGTHIHTFVFSVNVQP